MQVELSKEQVELTIVLIKTAIDEIESFNMGDEYDYDTTPSVELMNYYKQYIEE